MGKRCHKTSRFAVHQGNSSRLPGRCFCNKQSTTTKSRPGSRQNRTSGSKQKPSTLGMAVDNSLPHQAFCNIWTRLSLTDISLPYSPCENITSEQVMIWKASILAWLG